jgi:hypothetical protein
VTSSSVEEQLASVQEVHLISLWDVASKPFVTWSILQMYITLFGVTVVTVLVIAPVPESVAEAQTGLRLPPKLLVSSAVHVGLREGFMPDTDVNVILIAVNVDFLSEAGLN